MKKMAVYFDAYRIDHILGFFRIWEIPGEQIHGLLGQFNPSLPLSPAELGARGVWFDRDRLTKPYIRWHILEERFHELAEAVKNEFLEEPYPNVFQFKPELNSQRRVEAYIDEKITHFPDSQPYFDRIRKGVYSLFNEVILLPNPQVDYEAYDPRVAMQFTKSFQELDGWTQARLNEIYTDYFYKRHEHFWREQGLTKLPAIKDATDMLVCGEDLGMVPACVPDVMREMGILALQIQRMPKSNKKEFDHPGDAPYLSVVSPSTHDMGNLRAWWEEEFDVTQRFYSQQLGEWGGAPYFAEPWVIEKILTQHLYSPAMWAIIPLQDWIAIDGELRIDNPLEEQINVPADPEHRWCYRMHMTLESLNQQANLNEKIKHLVQYAGRNEDY